MLVSVPCDDPCRGQANRLKTALWHGDVLWRLVTVVVQVHVQLRIDLRVCVVAGIGACIEVLPCQNFVHWSWLLMIRSKERIWSRSSKSLAQYAAAVSKPSSWMRSRMSNGNKSGSICQLYASRARKANRWNTSASSMLTAKWSTCAPAVTKTNWQLPFHEHSCCKRMPKRNGNV